MPKVDFFPAIHGGRFHPDLNDSVRVDFTKDISLYLYFKPVAKWKIENLKLSKPEPFLTPSGMYQSSGFNFSFITGFMSLRARPRRLND